MKVNYSDYNLYLKRKFIFASETLIDLELLIEFLKKN